MSKTLKSGILLIFLALIALASIGAAPPVDPSAPAGQAPDRVLVKFKAGVDAATAAAVHRQNGGAVIRTIPQLGVHVVAVPSGSVAARVAAYARNGAVEYAEPDYIAHAVAKPAPPSTPPPTKVVNDPGFSQQWGMTKVQAPDAWGVTQGSSGVKIAILDTGMDQNHPDLVGKVGTDDSIRFVSTSTTLDDVYGHGTHVAGIAAAATNNDIGVAGLGYNTSLMNVKVLGDDGYGNYDEIALGVTWAADKGAKVINMSLGGGYDSETLRRAVDYAWGKGVVIVAAAGNDGTTRPFYPAYYPNCIAVGATDQRDRRASFSSFGSWVDVAAPGVSIYSTLRNGDYGTKSGTSMASPHVAGLAGLIWATSYGSSNGSVRSRIEGTADHTQGTGSQWSFGRINAYKAVK